MVLDRGDFVKKFKLQILTPKGDFFNEEVEAVSINTISGRIQILANHIPYVSGVKPTGIKIRNENTERYAVTSEGLVYFLNNNMEIFVDRAKWNEEKEEP